MSFVPVQVRAILRRHSNRVWCPVCGAKALDDCTSILWGRSKRIPHVRRGQLAARTYPETP